MDPHLKTYAAFCFCLLNLAKARSDNIRFIALNITIKAWPRINETHEKQREWPLPRGQLMGLDKKIDR